MVTLSLIAVLCGTLLYYFASFNSIKKKWAIRFSTYSMVLVAMLFSLNIEAQINLTASDATCLQNGELSWMPPANAPAGAIISYTIDDGMGNLTNLDLTMFSGLIAGTYTVTPFVDGVEGASETVEILDLFEPLMVDLSTNSVCGFRINVELVSGTLASIDVLSGSGNPTVSEDLMTITDVDFPETYGLLFTDDCGNTTQIDYTTENTFVTQIGRATPSCSSELSCDSVIYRLNINRVVAEEQPVTFDYTVTNSDGSSESFSETVFGISTEVTLPYTCGEEIDLDVTATLACGTVLEGLDAINSERPEILTETTDCIECLNIFVPFASEGLATFTFEDAPIGSELENAVITQEAELCVRRGSRRDLGAYEICPTEGPSFEPGFYSFTVDTECCSRSRIFTLSGPITPSFTTRYSCEEGEGIVQVSGVDAESITFNGDNGITDVCIDGRTIHTPSIPAGDYEVMITDTCGNTLTRDFTLQELKWPLGANIDIGCGAFNVSIRDDGDFAPVGSSNFSTVFEFILEHESSPGVFTEIDRTNRVGFGILPRPLVNITELGNFRLRREAGPYTCENCEDIYYFTQNSDGLDFASLEGIECSDGDNFLLSASSFGNPNFTYEVFDETGMTVGTGEAGNNENYILDDLSQGIYIVESSNSCGSQIREIELIDLPPLMIAGEALYCEGADAVLSIDNFSFLEYEWTFNGNVVSNLNTINLSNVQASDAGIYTAAVTSAANDCVNSNLSFELVVVPIVDAVFVNCYDDFLFIDETCVFINVGIQPEMPEMENCYDVFEFNNTTCEWDNVGSQPEMPEMENCYDGFVFNTETCEFDNVGSQPEMPTDLACDEQTIFDTNLCEWVISIDPNIISGCTDPSASNYNPNAICDDGSCQDCTGVITSLQINPYDGSPLLTLTDGQIFCASDFAATDVGIRALVDGVHESLFFTIDTPNGTGTKKENYETYDSHRFWATYPGTYTVTAQLYSENHLSGTLCDEMTLTFIIEDCSDNCTGAITSFQINAHDGTALQTLADGQVLCAADFASTDVSIRALVDGEHESLFFTIDTPNGTGTKKENYETYDSHRFWATYPGTYTVTAQLYSENHLSGTLCDEMTLTFIIEDCSDNCTGAITSFQINAHDGTALQTLTDGQVLCAADFASTDVSIRALVDGEHESLFFTIDTPNGTGTKKENYETYDSRRFWATYPGTYTVTAQLYSENHLLGTLCDEMTLTFVIEDCSDNCTGAITSFQINAHDGTALQTLADGQVLCAADFASTDVSIRALVDGEHESLFFTIETPNGTSTKKENYETYDSRRFWATYPGSYTITAQLYSENHLSGTLCDEMTLTFVIENAGSCGAQGLSTNADDNRTDDLVGFSEEVNGRTFEAKEATDEALQVFPNPATEVLYIKGLQDSSYEVYNIAGIKVIGESKSNKIELIDLPYGAYIIKTIDGRLIKFLKIKH